MVEKQNIFFFFKMTRCAVKHCRNIGVHCFPKDKKICRQWLKAIRREKMLITSSSRLCRSHFLDSDYEQVSKYTGVEHQHHYLKKGAIPKIFSWNTQPISTHEKAREERFNIRNLNKRQLFDVPSTSQNCPDVEPLAKDDNVYLNINVSHEILIETNDSTPKLNYHDNKTCGTQTSNILRLLSTESLLADDEAVHYYTGLETAAKFSLVLSTLLPMANNLKYCWSQVIGLSVEDQFLMLLMKLRRNMTEFELGKMFGVGKTEVSNIIVTWVNFVSDIWSLIDIWPSCSLLNFYMPNSFKKHYPSTKVIIDGTEISIQKPSQPDDQKASFSTSKHKNSLKCLVGASPGGLLTCASDAYAGSVSDRQIVESNLFELCDTGDSIMADTGFNVEDLFAFQGTHINIPTFFKGKSQIPGIQLKIDQKLASEKVQIERLIGLTKTYLILKSELNHYYVPLASKIIAIIVMLCNFREGIVNKNK